MGTGLKLRCTVGLRSFTASGGIRTKRRPVSALLDGGEGPRDVSGSLNWLQVPP